MPGSYRNVVRISRLARLYSLVPFLCLLLPGLVFAQVSESASSKEVDLEGVRGWEEHMKAMRAARYRDDMIQDDHFWRKSEAHGLVYDGLRSDLLVAGIPVVKPVAHVSVNICDRTPAVMEAILSKIPETNNCSEVTSTQLAAIAGELNLSSRDILSLEAGDFDGLISLRRLWLGGNALVTLPDGVFDQLTSLIWLHLPGNALVTLPDSIFDQLTSLTWLNLRSNALVTLPSGIFDQLSSLTWLDMWGNALAMLPANIFDHLTSLTWIDLDDNDLVTLPDGIFDQLASLTDLGLSRNDLVALPDDVFDRLTSLNRLNLGGNALVTLPDDIFDQLSSLTTLWWYENDLVTLPDGIFDQLSSLTVLNLGGNNLTELPDGIFDQLTSLIGLSLWGNALITLPDGIFDELTLLTGLSLSRNDLVALPDGIFDQLTSLTTLWLYENALVALPDSVFDQLTSLTTLSLSDIALVTLPDGIFDQLTSLTRLDLSRNGLVTLPNDIFDQLTEMNSLYLDFNDLVTLPDGIFEDLTSMHLRPEDSYLLVDGLSLGANPGAPFKPVVNAGADLTVQPGAAVLLSGSVSGPWGGFVRWDWAQVDGPDSETPLSAALPLTGGDTAMPSFTAPMAEGELYFKVVAVPGHQGKPNEDYGHAYSDPDWITVTVSSTPTNASEAPVVVDFALLGNYPNPFNSSTAILLDVPQVATISVDVFNVLGQRVHREEFPAVAAGSSRSLPLEVAHLSSGAYVYQITARTGRAVHRAGGRMALIK